MATSNANGIGRRTLSSRFPEAWAQLPVNGRYLTALAERVGLQVEHDGESWIWAGTRDQFEASGMVPPGIAPVVVRTRYIHTAEGLRGDLRVTSEGLELVSIWFWVRPRADSRAAHHTLRRAEEDADWLAFRSRMLQPVTGVQDEQQPRE